MKDRLWTEVEELMVARDYRPSPGEVVETVLAALREAAQ
jgi:hypothetical protein